MAHMRRMAAFAALAASSALVLAACTGTDDPTTGPSGGDTGGEKEPVTITWWHNAVAGDSGENTLGDFWQKVADDFTADNPHVTIQIEQIQNEDLQRTRIPTALQSGDAPDMFQQWGGGEMAAQAEAGYLMDVSDILADDIARLGGSVGPWQADGKTYGLPFQFAVEGIWYRKSLFEKAGITSEPTTFDELNAAVQKLKDAGITPIAVGASDKWPAAHWWYNFALQACSQDVIKNLGSFDFSDPCFIKAGEDLQKFIDTKPFQNDYMSTVAQTGATSSAGLVANGNAAMELMGQWNFFVYQGFTDGSDEGIAALLDDLDWFPVPGVGGGQGDPTAALGGGDGFSCYVDAPVECAEFLSYIVSDEVQSEFAEVVGGMPVAPGAASSVAHPINQEIAAAASSAAYVQLWLDTDLGPNVGGALNDGIVTIFAGTGGPQAVVDAVVAAAATE